MALYDRDQNGFPVLPTRVITTTAAFAAGSLLAGISGWFTVAAMTFLALIAALIPTKRDTR
jgi:hypothetical protein